MKKENIQSRNRKLSAKGRKKHSSFSSSEMLKPFEKMYAAGYGMSSMGAMAASAAAAPYYMAGHHATASMHAAAAANSAAAAAHTGFTGMHTGMTSAAAGGFSPSSFGATMVSF